jgi:hypothetical protein
MKIGPNQAVDCCDDGAPVTRVRSVKAGILTVLTLQVALLALPAAVQLRINLLAKNNNWHRDCRRQRYLNANQDLSIISKIFS